MEFVLKEAVRKRRESIQNKSSAGNLSRE